MMQILAGKYKGVNIRTSAKINYRPTQSKVRKSLFDILGNLNGQIVVDLFAGSGILGFEALSRDAEKIIFVERNRILVDILYRNCRSNNIRNYSIINYDALKFLKKKNPVDLILADPPYGQKDLNSLVKLSMESLNPNGKLILETSKKDGMIDSDFEKIYGDTRLSFWRK